MTYEEKAEEIKYLRFATEEDKTKRDLFKLALDRRYLINDLVKENAELKKENESQKRYIESLKDLIKTSIFFNENNNIEMYQLWKGIKMEIGK